MTDHRAPEGAADPTAAAPRLLVGRQGVFDRSNLLHGHEFFARHASTHEAWPAGQRTAADEHVATIRVLSTILGGGGPAAVSGVDQAVFVNASYLVLAEPALIVDRPDRLVLEVTATVTIDRAVLDGIQVLRQQGIGIAVDDFRGSAEQRALLPFADYVKIDARDLVTDGFTLLEAGRAPGVVLVAKRVEQPSVHRTCELMGFDLFQGNALEPTVVLDRTQESPVGAAG